MAGAAACTSALLPLPKRLGRHAQVIYGYSGGNAVTLSCIASRSRRRDRVARVIFGASSITRHAAVLGGTGSAGVQPQMGEATVRTLTHGLMDAASTAAAAAGAAAAACSCQRLHVVGIDPHSVALPAAWGITADATAIAIAASRLGAVGAGGRFVCGPLHIGGAPRLANLSPRGYLLRTWLGEDFCSRFQGNKEINAWEFQPVAQTAVQVSL